MMYFSARAGVMVVLPINPVKLQKLIVVAGKLVCARIGSVARYGQCLNASFRNSFLVTID
jgi:hypothetical protein